MTNHIIPNMSPFVYYISVLWRSIIGYIFYRIYLYRSIPNLDSITSNKILIYLLMFSVLFYLFFVPKDLKNTWTTIAAVSIPLGSYTVVAYRKTIPLVANSVVFIMVSVVLFFLCILFLSLHKYKYKHKVIERKIIWCRIKKSLYCISCSFTLIMLLFIGGVALCCKPISASVEAKRYISEKSHEDLIDENIESLYLFKSWNHIKTSQKIDLLQVITNIECQYLGLPPLTLVAENLPSFTLGEYYDGEEKTITININYLECEEQYCFEEVLHTTIHEVFHSYEHRLAELLCNLNDSDAKNLRIFRDTRQYLFEIENYIHYVPEIDNYLDYEIQKLELDADNYADLTSKYYIEQINKLKDGNN